MMISDGRLLQRVGSLIDHVVLAERAPELVSEAAQLARDLVPTLLGLQPRPFLTLVECIRDPAVRSGAYWFRPVDWPETWGALSIASNDNQAWIMRWNADASYASRFDPRLPVLEADFVRLPARRLR